MIVIKGSELLLQSLVRHNINLSVLVADTAVWANPGVHHRLRSDTGSEAMFPYVRRARSGKGEKRGERINGVRLDDNSYANIAIKRATGLGRSAVGFEVCHIWPATCYDARYHTAIANLVLIPRALAGLSDHDPEVQKALQYRAYELYKWWPQDQPEPKKPEAYPENWRPPQEDSLLTPTKPGHSQNDSVTDEVRRTLKARIEQWARKPKLNVHKMIALVVERPNGIDRGKLVELVEEVTQSINAYGAIASLLTNSGNAYGKIFEERNGLISIDRDLEEFVRSLKWHIKN